MFQACRVTEVVNITDLTEDYMPERPFSMYLAPVEGGTSEVGDVEIVNAILPYGAGQTTRVPVNVGDWSPVVFLALPADSIDLNKYEVFVSPIKMDMGLI